MPWKESDVDEHKKGLTPAQKKKWVSIANGILADCQKNGGSDCEGKAIRVANSKFSEDCEECPEEMEMLEQEWSDDEWTEHDDFIDDFVSADDSQDEEGQFDQAADRKKPGGSNAGKYKKGPFCGPSGGAPKGSYPVDTKKRAKAAIAYARHAPNPGGIKACVCRHWPSLPSCKKKTSMDGMTMKTENQKIPVAALHLMDHSPVKFAVEGEKEKLDMVIYSGGLIKGHWWWGDLAIDLAGMSFPKKKFPILENHDTARKIGFGGKPPVVEGQLRINPESVEFVDTPESLEFRKLSKQGFPYEASMYALPTVVQRLMEKETAEVNGMTVKGPASIWRKAVFKEASVCVFGWDTNTRSATFSNDEMEITLEVQTKGESALADSESKSKGEEGARMDLSELKARHADLVTALRAEFTAETAAEKTKLESTIADLRTQLQQKDAVITSQEDRVLKLEKAEAIRREKDRVAEADRVFTEKLEMSEIPEHLYGKVKAQVSYTKFVKDEVLDTDAFGKAIDAEITDWVGKGVIKTVIGGGKLSKTVASETQTSDEKADDETVTHLLSLTGQDVKSK